MMRPAPLRGCRRFRGVESLAHFGVLLESIAFALDKAFI
jgi:hypothetical protein